MKCNDVLRRFANGYPHRVVRGRSGNTSFVFEESGTLYQLKIGAGTSRRLQEIYEIDQLLRGTAKWYPALEDADLSASGDEIRSIRKFYVGDEFDFSWQQCEQVLSAVVDLRSLTGFSSQSCTGDYATCWLRDLPTTTNAALNFRPGVGVATKAALIGQSDMLTAAASQLTQEEALTVTHGDLHGLNLIFSSGRLNAVIDWDDACLSPRPIDVGKTLWFLCRNGRGRFQLCQKRTSRYYQFCHSRRVVAGKDLDVVHLLGALYFLPIEKHLSKLSRTPDMLDWYIRWIEEFWSSFGVNLEVIEQARKEAAR